MTPGGHEEYLIAGVALFVLGFYGVVACRPLLRQILGLNLMGSGVFLIFITTAAHTPGPVPDPVPHAMVLTGIVVAVCATGLALALAEQVQNTTAKNDVEEENH